MLFLLFIAACLSIAVYDIKYRRIPNLIILFIIALRVLYLITEFDSIVLIDSLIGLIFASITFMIPKIIHMRIGWGDIKYSSALGFCLGFPDYVYSMLACVLCTFLYLLFRKCAMEKDIKAFQLPLGTFMSIGSVIIITLKIIL